MNNATFIKYLGIILLFVTIAAFFGGLQKSAQASYSRMQKAQGYTAGITAMTTDPLRSNLILQTDDSKHFL